MTASAISTMQNSSLLLYGPGQAKYEDRPIPEISEPDDVIVRVAYTGVCGSDVSPAVTISTVMEADSRRSISCSTAA